MIDNRVIFLKKEHEYNENSGQRYLTCLKNYLSSYKTAVDTFHVALLADGMLGIPLGLTN